MSSCYVEMLERFVKPKLNDLDENAEVWLQQDGAAGHTVKRSMSLFEEMFGFCLISVCANVKWPACSPDLLPCDHCLKHCLG